MVSDPLYEATGGLRSQELIDAADETDSIMFDEWEKRKTTLQRIEPYSEQLLELTQQDFIELFLYVNKDGVLKTLLTKELFIFGERTGLNAISKFEWKPYHYGPYSPNIEKELTTLQIKGVVREETISTEKYPTIYRELLIQPERAEQILEKIPEVLKQVIVEIANEFKKMKVKEIENFVHIAYPKYAINVLK